MNEMQTTLEAKIEQKIAEFDKSVELIKKAWRDPSYRNGGTMEMQRALAELTTIFTDIFKLKGLW